MAITPTDSEDVLQFNQWVQSHTWAHIAKNGVADYEGHLLFRVLRQAVENVDLGLLARVGPYFRAMLTAAIHSPGGFLENPDTRGPLLQDLHQAFEIALKPHQGENGVPAAMAVVAMGESHWGHQGADYRNFIESAARLNAWPVVTWLVEHLLAQPHQLDDVLRHQTSSHLQENVLWRAVDHPKVPLQVRYALQTAAAARPWVGPTHAAELMAYTHHEHLAGMRANALVTQPATTTRRRARP